MDFQKGDTVSLLHSQEEAVIVKTPGNGIIVVDIQGVIFPVYTDQVKMIRKGDAPLPGEKKSVSLKTSSFDNEKKTSQPETGAWLSFSPTYRLEEGEELVDKLKMTLLNDTATGYIFQYNIYTARELMFFVKGELPAFSDFYLNDLLFDDLNDYPRLEFHFSLQTPDPALAETLEKTVKLKPKQMVAKLSEIKQRKDSSFRLQVFEKYPRPEAAGKEDWFPGEKIHDQPAFVSSSASPDIFPKYELDLHIEKLVEHPRDLDNFEMLTIQLHEFQRYLDLAIGHRQFSMVVIHGVGKGKLRDEVHEILRRTHQVKNFINQYDVRYGYGATEIFFEY